jgi:hypothetical protein
LGRRRSGVVVAAALRKGAVVLGDGAMEWVEELVTAEGHEMEVDRALEVDRGGRLRMIYLRFLDRSFRNWS